MLVCTYFSKKKFLNKYVGMELWDTKTREGYPRRNSILKHLLFGVAPEKLPVIEDPALQNAKFPL